MSLNPRIKRIVLPPSSVVSKTASLITQLDTLRQPSETSSSLGNATPSNNNSTPVSTPVPIPRLLTQHPVLPWVAYILEDKLIIVQHTVTKAILYHTHIQDVAAAVYGETEPKKLPAAAKSLGRIRNLLFYDCSTIYWSGLHTVTSDPPYPVYPSLAVQTDRRVLVLNLRQGASHISPVVAVQCAPPRSYYRPVTAHVCEKTVSSVPSSTVLPLTDRWLLVGCADGSMKCYDWTAAVTVKKIKGLGKGDCVVQLLAATPYHGQHEKPRILTVTKRGTVFLIALDLQKDTLEIQPPMARFTVPETTTNATSSSLLEQTTFSYNAHTDTFQWYCTAEKQEPVLYTWDLQGLTSNKTGGMAKPEPSLVIHYPAVSMAAPTQGGLPGLGSLLPHDIHTPEPTSNKPTLSSVVRTDTAILGGLVHPAFDTDTFVSVSVTARGDLCLHGVSKSSTMTNATPVVMIKLADWIVQAMGEDETFPSTDLQVYSLTHQPLGGAACHVVVATNWGVVVVDLGIATVSPERRTLVGARHWHLGAGLGSLGKAVVGVRGGGALVYGSLDVSRTTAPGWLAVKNPTTLYTSSVSQHMPPEFTKRPFRMAAQFLTSPTGVYVAVFWPAEFRYEILHTATSLQGVGNTNRGNASPVVASGTGVADFCWVTDADIFCILHAPEKQEAAAQEVPKQLEESPGNFILSPLGVVATTVTKTAIAVPLSATKLATTAAVTTTTAAVNTTMTAANMTVGATTKAVRATTKGVTQIGAKALGIFGKKKRGGDGSIMTAEEEEEEVSHTITAADLGALTTPTNAGISTFQQQPRKEQERFVEFRQLEEIGSAKAVEGGIPAATCATLGKLTLRGGNRVLPAAIFGGPVLCVATRTEDGNDGQAQFYSHKSFDDLRAESFVSAGPSLPFPETVVWDDDGKLCALVVENRVAVYLSSSPEFVLLGTVHIGSPSVTTTNITCVKFVHGILYCCTWNTVHCVLLGDLTGGICHLDAYLLACTEVAMIPEASWEETVSPFAPIPQYLPLVQPTVLGYQGGSLVVSSLCGIHAVSLNFPSIRIGIFLAAGQVEKAVKWFDAVPDSHHETLATFLERRGHPELILQLPGLSLETMVDVCMRFAYVDRLEEIVETYGIHGLHEIDMGQGVVRTVFGPEPDSAPSIVVSVGAYLMAHGRVELARRMAAECLRSKHGKKDAFMLATLLMPVDQADASRLVQRAVAGDDVNEDWAVGNFVRNYLLNERT